MEEKVVGCGAPPFGLRPHYVLLACFIGLLDFGIAGVAAGFAGGEIDGIDNNNTIYNSVTTETPVMCVGHVSIYSGFDTLSLVVQDRLLQVVGSALAVGDPAVTGGGTAAAASEYAWWYVHQRRALASLEVHWQTAGVRIYFDHGNVFNGLHTVCRAQFGNSVFR
ncbi:hypothetical protein CYMTET_40623 [Cymbomonas tetramitiformis]|uniref:Uncharacterized protein n=1 Tax=Cymbomonas tetramitiformis TaxID=36881 RepID=A0AAE0C7P3_9CHLO|nr:hypothetical protein CYMTET_40623 [Cymbomonas tetramitiformis]